MVQAPAILKWVALSLDLQGSRAEKVKGQLKVLCSMILENIQLKSNQSALKI